MQPPALVVAVYVFISIGFAFIVQFFAALVSVGPERHLSSPAVAIATFSTLTVAFIATWLTRLGTREPIGLTESRIGAKLLIGGALGALAITLSVLGPVVAGASTLTLSRPVPVLAGVLQFCILAPAGIGEELLIRGLGFNALRRGVGDTWAVLISSLVFGVMHVLNPSSSWLAVLMIALVGIWFGLLTIKSGSLWMPIGAHLAWNFFEGFVFGQPVSGGFPKESFFLAKLNSDSAFWSGGNFGPEAAGFTALVLAAAIVFTLLKNPAFAQSASGT